MKDFNGVEVKVGDSVICMVKGYRSLMKAEVIDITPKTVLVEYQVHWTTSEYKDTYRLMGDQFIVVNKGE